LSAALGGFIVAVILMVRLLPKTPWWRKFILTHEEKGGAGYVSSDNRQDLVGKTGTAITVLRPSGMAEIDGEKIDVVADGDYIPAQARIRVKAVAGPRVIVERNL
jgi:membrane-bound serine protease (ClpP class)